MKPDQLRGESRIVVPATATFTHRTSARCDAQAERDEFGIVMDARSAIVHVIFC